MKGDEVVEAAKVHANLFLFLQIQRKFMLHLHLLFKTFCNMINMYVFLFIRESKEAIYMKTAFYVESYGRQVEEKALIAKIKEIWVAEGNKIKDIKDLNIYAKPEDDACYYTINGDFSGHIKLYE